MSILVIAVVTLSFQKETFLKKKLKEKRRRKVTESSDPQENLGCCKSWSLDLQEHDYLVASPKKDKHFSNEEEDGEKIHPSRVESKESVRVRGKADQSWLGRIH